MTAQISDLGHGLKLVERYQVAERLSDGGLCAVYRGQDLTLRRPIAIKVVPPSHVESYRAALRLSASFSHPAVVCVYDMIEQDSSLYLIQEYVAERALSDYLLAGLPVERAVDIASQIAFALSYAHVKGVIHGDLTPAAVLIDRHALVRLNNFYAPADETYFTRARDAVARDIRLETKQIAVQPDETGDVIALGYLLWLMTTERTAQSDQPADMFLRSTRADVPETLTALLRRIFDASSAPSSDLPQRRSLSSWNASPTTMPQLVQVPYLMYLRRSKPIVRLRNRRNGRTSQQSPAGVRRLNGWRAPLLVPAGAAHRSFRRRLAMPSSHRPTCLLAWLPAYDFLHARSVTAPHYAQSQFRARR